LLVSATIETAAVATTAKFEAAIARAIKLAVAAIESANDVAVRFMGDCAPYATQEARQLM
jgi:hypothetical protein